MSQKNDDQEIDLSVIGQKISGFIDSIGHGVYKIIKFFQKKIIIIAILFIVGAVLGYFLDKNNDSYTSEIVVIPNFGSTDDLYAKVDLLQSRVAENDTVFLKQIGISSSKNIGLIAVEPVIDIYNFVSNSPINANNTQNNPNFELVKLLAEDGDINKIIKDEVTSKNYAYHRIKISSNGHVSQQKQVAPILNYLNSSAFFQNQRKVTMANIETKISENQMIIAQVNSVLAQFENNIKNNQKSEKLIYNNENNQLNDLIINKNNLISEIGNLKLQLSYLDEIIKPKSIVLNQKNNKGLNGKMGKVLPILFLFLFFGLSFVLFVNKKFHKKYA